MKESGNLAKLLQALENHNARQFQDYFYECNQEERIKAILDAYKKKLDGSTEGINQIVVFIEAEVNEIHKDDDMPLLSIAAGNGDIDAVEALITFEAFTNGIDIYDDSDDDDVNTPLYEAVKGGHTQIANYLLANGAKPYIAISSDGKSKMQTALHAAAHRGDVEMLELLLSKLVKIEAETSLGETALFFACLSGNIKAVDLLIKKGARLDHLTTNGDTLLHAACKVGKGDLIEYLVNLGLNPKETNKHGVSPLDIANSNSNDDAAETLLELDYQMKPRDKIEGKLIIKYKTLDGIVHDTKPENYSDKIKFIKTSDGILHAVPLGSILVTDKVKTTATFPKVPRSTKKRKIDEITSEDEFDWSGLEEICEQENADESTSSSQTRPDKAGGESKLANYSATAPNESFISLTTREFKELNLQDFYERSFVSENVTKTKWQEYQEVILEIEEQLNMEIKVSIGSSDIVFEFYGNSTQAYQVKNTPVAAHLFTASAGMVVNGEVIAEGFAHIM